MPDAIGTCECGRETDQRHALNPFNYETHQPRYECSGCKRLRENAYDDYVDPGHHYHSHDSKGATDA